MGIITLNENDDMLKGITRLRPVATIPFGGRYRIIDFILSSMVNSGIKNVGILAQDKHRSLVDHLRSGKDWDLDRKRDGLFIFTPEGNGDINRNKGLLKNLYYNLGYINKSKQSYVIISNSNLICNINFSNVLCYHLKNKADITMLYKNIHNIEINNTFFTTLHITDDNRIVDIEVNPVKPTSNNISLDILIIDKSLLTDLVDACISRGNYDFIKDGLIKNLAMLNIHGYEHKGYVAKIDSIGSYFEYSLDLLKQDVWQELFFKPGLIYTKVKDGAPAKYLSSSDVKNVLVANGCVIEGTVENSILFRGVKVANGAHIKNSIVMQKCIIESDVIIENVILDKEVHVTKGKQLKGDNKFPVYIEKKVVI